jgi:hypothetical protein
VAHPFAPFVEGGGTQSRPSLARGVSFHSRVPTDTLPDSLPAALLPTLAKNARMGHPQRDGANESRKGGPPVHPQRGSRRKRKSRVGPTADSHGREPALSGVEGTPAPTSSNGRPGLLAYGNSPNTATPLGVPTYTLPFTIVGVMNLLPPPNWSRDPAWLLL